MASIRPRKGTDTFELRVVHRRLDKPYYSTHDSREAAVEYAAKVKAGLDDGSLTPSMLTPAEEGSAISVVIGRYINEASISDSDRDMAEWLRANVQVRVGKLTYGWVETWVKEMKADKLAPGTIRKKVECLARVLDWHNRKTHELDKMPANPLRVLPRGYSTYTEVEGDVEDVERDRRLEPGEEERILAALDGQKRDDRQRPYVDVPDAAFKLLYLLIVNSGLRLREAYTLRGFQIRKKLRTIHIARSKTGKARDVPMTPEIYAMVPDGLADNQLLFPFWDGTEADLKKCTARLSKRFKTLFEYAKCVDLTEHDLRHEATCRWMLMRDSRGNWIFRPEEVRRITGHKNVQQFERYLSLRGSDLADRLY